MARISACGVGLAPTLIVLSELLELVELVVLELELEPEFELEQPATVNSATTATMLTTTAASFAAFFFVASAFIFFLSPFHHRSKALFLAAQ